MKNQEEELDEDEKKVLDIVKAHPEGLGIRELSKRLGMTRPMITKIVNHLDALQLVVVFKGKRGEKFKVLPASGFVSREKRERKMIEYPSYLFFATLLCGTCSRGRDHLCWEGGEMTMAEFEQRIAKLGYKWSKIKKSLNFLDKIMIIDVHKESKNKFEKIVLPPFDVEEIRKPEKKYLKTFKKFLESATKE
jgi:DNA-binding MarR family transcriptional regulator